MSNIMIKVTTKRPRIEEGLLSHWGKITIDSFEERFIMPIEWWSAQDYQQQWQEGLKRIQTHETSCLVTCVQNMEVNPWVEWWIMYRQKSRIFVQNHTLFYDNFKQKLAEHPFFNVETCYLYIHARRIFTEEGDKISEWSTTLEPVY